MPFPRQVPTVFMYADVPRFVYLFRKWFDDPADGTSTCAQVVVISDNQPLGRLELRSRLESMDVGEVSEFVLIDMNPGCGAVLDTWERGIAGYMEEFATPCRCFKYWWDADLCTEVDEE